MAVQSADIVGKTLAGRYEILSFDREEELGAVFHGRDLNQGTRVSVKVLHPFLTEDREKFKRFGREITNTWMVAHQNTVEVLDWGDEGEIYYLVMESLKAHPLRDELQLGPLDTERVARITAQIAAAIGAAHQEGIVHRSLSLDSILLLENVEEGDFVKVRDFSLSKLEKAEGEETALTAHGDRVGNMDYMPPEYIETGTYPTKGDLYALGALMFHMLTGRPPFVGTSVKVMQAHVSQSPAPPSSITAGIPQWMDELVLELLQKAPEKRPGAYRVVQRLETGIGTSLDRPKLLMLDENGEVVVPKATPMIAIVLGVGLLVLTASAILIVALVVIGVAIILLGS